MKYSWNSTAIRAAAILLLTFVAYAPALTGGFVFDDHQLIVNNPLIKAGDGLYRFWFTTDAPDYYPLTWSFWWLQYRLWGNSPAGYHIVNVLLHAANAALVWLILRKLNVPGAWVAGLIFALHPVNVATAAWISEQKNTLSMLFYAFAILAYLNFDKTSRWSCYNVSLGSFLLALLSKSAVVMLPVVLLLCLWWRHGRVRRTDLLACAPFFLLALVFGLVTVWFQSTRAMWGTEVESAGFASRLATAGWVPWFYLYKSIWPVNLSVIYPKWNWSSFVPGILWAGCFTLCWWKRRTWGRPLLFGLGYFVVTLFPVLGFFEQGFYHYSMVADHWQYYSIIGVIALVSAVMRTTWAPSVVIAALTVATWSRAGVYANGETLWRDTVAKNPEAWLAHYNLGLELEQTGRQEEAMEHWNQSVRIKPDYTEAYNNMGVVLWQTGRKDEARAQWEQALQLQPRDPQTLNNLGVARQQAGALAEAIECYEQAVAIKPGYIEARYNLADAAKQAGDLDRAIGQYQQLLERRPDDAKFHHELAAILWRTGRTPEAISHWEQTLRLKPDSAEAHNNLGAALVEQGRLKEGVGHLEQALLLRPDYAKAHYNLGNALEQAGRIPDAIQHYEQALRLDPSMIEAHNELMRLRKK